MNVRLALSAAAAVVTFLAGCGSGNGTTNARPTFTANPSLPGVTTRQSAPMTAAGIARGIATRWAAADGPVSVLNTPIEFREVDYSASVFAPGTSRGFTAFLTTRRTTVVMPSSAAMVDIVNYAPPRFATSIDQSLWKADGRPSLGQAPVNGQRLAFPAGQFSFLPQGSTLTYQQVTSLPSDPHQFAATILGHLHSYAGAHPPASLQLKQLGYLIATSPLSIKARSAAWQALASLPGLSICANQPIQARTHTAELCIDSPTDETQISVDTSAGAILAVTDRLIQSSPLYPHVPAGTVDNSSTFTTP